MKNPTHFIEVYSNTIDTYCTGIVTIDLLDKYLEKTSIEFTLKTIAVWKIKFKENATPPIPRKID